MVVGDEDDVPSVDDTWGRVREGGERKGEREREREEELTWDPHDDGEDDVNEELAAASCLNQHRERGKEDRNNKQQNLGALDTHHQREPKK